MFNDLKLLNKSERELTNARTEGKIDEDSIISTRKNYNWMQDKQKEVQYLLTYLILEFNFLKICFIIDVFLPFLKHI